MRREDSHSYEGVSNQVEAKVRNIPWGNDLSRYLHELSAIIKPKCIVLFGSTARGEWEAYSDIDVLIVSDDLPDDFFKSLTTLYKPRRGRVQPFGYTTTKVGRFSGGSVGSKPHLPRVKVVSNVTMFESVWPSNLLAGFTAPFRLKLHSNP